MRRLSLVVSPTAIKRSFLVLAAVPILAVASWSGTEWSGAALRATVCLGAFALAAAWLRRRQGPPSTPLVSVEARQPLSRESGLALVRVDSRRLLVGYSSNGVTFITQLIEEKPIPPPLAPERAWRPEEP